MTKKATKFSANLGFLWQELDLLDGIRAAANAGFVAVECHWPFAYETKDVRAVLAETGLPMLSLNTHPGNTSLGEFGLCAHPNKLTEAREAIDQALAYAVNIDTPNVHIMSGKVATSIDPELAQQTFYDNLRYAATRAEQVGITLLIEPINNIDVPDYYVADMHKAVELVTHLDLPNLKIMFDCFHIQKVHGKIKPLLTEHLAKIGHIQIASHPNRNEPDEGEIDYAELFNYLQKIGYTGYVGAEYKPRSSTDAGLGWLTR